MAGALRKTEKGGRRQAAARPPESASTPLGEAMRAASEIATRWTGSAAGFGAAVGIIVIWAAIGPFVRFSDTWQLVINTGTTIITFLMVFLIQRTQNKDALAIQLKLDELVASMSGASNRLIDVESLTEDDLQTLRQFYTELAEIAKRDERLSESHSVEEARGLHGGKR